MKKLFAIAALSSVILTSPAHAFDVGDALQIVETLSGVVGTMNRPVPPQEPRSSLSDQLDDLDGYDLECRLRGFDGWYDNKCRNLNED